MHDVEYGALALEARKPPVGQYMLLMAVIDSDGNVTAVDTLLSPEYLTLDTASMSLRFLIPAMVAIRDRLREK